ncbi:WGR domain-containing protein [Coraliomargarita sp. SDUM461003]|uniref:WGR domain-containing protein n=1 Tax=Thalassobacterium maritimum TaxID=3041265 RepID=A0ABU1AUN4_9BACT|nr:WGR domain-containing protein [Coraliomargarita sp. SDUM461003]MDQ8207874.1 WGR domain-containing protein [Coraliomargarita sp. SDUM461003]
MKLIRQIKLYFKKANSDKVYEVDLCEAGPGEFIVNFRYGRRNARLKEGTKTPFPESKAKAENIFSKLVAAKTAKGYLIVDESGRPDPAPKIEDPVQWDSLEGDPRVVAVIDRLKRGYVDEGWKLSRAVWRAGQWRLKQAMPLLAALVDQARAMNAWSLAWAIGQIGESEHCPLIDRLISNSPKDRSLRKIAREAKLRLLVNADREAFIADVRSDLPSALRDALESDSVVSLSDAIREAVEAGDGSPDLSADLFLISSDTPSVREALYSVAKSIDTRKNGMLLLRQLFKAAEFRLDAEIYGVIAQRFESDFGNGFGRYDFASGKYTRPGFSTTTKQYFRRRIYRTLKQAGADDDAATFIPLATGILLAYDDSVDRPQSSNLSRYFYDPKTRRMDQRVIHYPPRNECNSFVYILRGKSQVLKQPEKSLSWQYVGESLPAAEREEVFPHLWDAAPEAIMHLLLQSRSAEVQDFALRVWNDHSDWIADAELSFVIGIVSSWYEPTARLGLEIARSLWDPDSPQEILLLAMLDSESTEACELGGQWLKQIQQKLNGFPDLVSRIIFVSSESSRQVVRDCLAAASLNLEVKEKIVARAISALLSLSGDEEDSTRAQFAVDVLHVFAAQQLRALPIRHLAEFSIHPLEQLQVLGAQILIAQDIAATLPQELLLAPLSSDFASVRRLGLELLKSLTDSLLVVRSEVLAGCAVSEHADLREHVRPLIKRLALKNSDFCKELVEQWYPLLLRAEIIEGIHADLYELLTDSLAAHLDAIPADSYSRMLDSQYAQAQALGFTLLKRNADLNEVSLGRLVEWAGHPHAELRQYVWNHFMATPHLIRENLGDCLELLESDWADSKQHAMVFFREVVEEADWKPESLVSICDSTQVDVQDFGREMITRRFKDEDGPYFLMQLSQHPSTELQIFASNYLIRYAVDQPDRIALLEPYFRTVLTKIGAGRIAKQRIFSIIEQESMKDRGTAELAVQLLDRISATMAIGDKASCIYILQNIAREWPDLESPLAFAVPPVRQPFTV